MQKSIIGLSILASSFLYGGFDFGGSDEGCSGGTGDSFEQPIANYGGDYEKTMTVGTIPKNLKDVKISLKSDKDVDIRLYDVNGKKIVHWPYGLLNGSGKNTKTYNGVTIEYSGYNGDGSGLGHEYIKISGTTKNDFIMKAFGYKAGFAKVDYSWAGKANCSDSSAPSASGTGTFQQQILYKKVVKVDGTIPPGINDLYISLKSDKDVDVQLFDKDNGKALVGWNIGALIGNGSGYAKTPYKGLTIEYSGYNGDGTNLGNEYIKLTGKTTSNLIMKAYGYQAGYAKIDYKWGKGETPPPSTIKGIKFISATPASGKSYANVGENITFKASTYSSSDGKIKVYIQYHTGVNYLEKKLMTKQSSTLWTDVRALKAGKQKKYKITVEKLDGTIVDTQVKSIEVKDLISSKTLDVPYLYQRDVPYIGSSACASASSAMVLAYHGKIGNSKSSMIEATKKVFKLTGSSVLLGLQGRHTLVNTLKNSYNFSYVKFEEPLYEPLYKIIKDEINAGRPLILGSRYSMVNGGHYMVVIGYDGATYNDAKLIINDPEGKWLGTIGKYQLGKGQAVKYDFTTITSQLSDGVFVIHP